MKTNELLYKYLPPERLDVLRDGRIRFTPPAALNDMFECSPVLDVSVTSKALKANLVQRLTAEVARSLDLPYLDADEKKSLQRLVVDAESVADRICDPEVLSRKILDGIRTTVSHKVGVLSLSKTPRNPDMWAKYASNNTGFLLGLDPSSRWFRVEAIKGEPTNPITVDYVINPPVVRLSCFDTGNSEDLYQKMLGTKMKVWESEEEVRITRSFLGDHDCIGQDLEGWEIRLFYIEKAAISCVVLGAKADPEMTKQIERLLDLHDMNHVQMLQARPDRRTGKIETAPLIRRPI